MARHFLDHAASSPLRPEVADAIVAWARTGSHADPGRPYVEGRSASAQVESARAALAGLLGVGERRVIFTSGGTEAANWADRIGRARAPDAPVLLAGVEHSAVRLAAEAGGAVLDWHVDRHGRVDLGELERHLAGPTRPGLVHCQWANHEVGTIQPVVEVVTACRDAGVAVHVDACSALGRLPLELGALGADLVSISAHKAGGPPGIGALVLGERIRARPLLVGGDQERARRAGMENAIGIVGFGALAGVLAEPGRLESECRRAGSQTGVVRAVAGHLDGIELFGDPVHRLEQLVCFGIADVEAEAVLISLDQVGVAVHSGSACSSEAIEPSPVLLAMGLDADHSLRCSVGWSTTDEDVSAFAENLPEVLARLRALRA